MQIVVGSVVFTLVTKLFIGEAGFFANFDKWKKIMESDCDRQPQTKVRLAVTSLNPDHSVRGSPNMAKYFPSSLFGRPD